jgi:predicted DCC family thiol-disulfide oxidoreductase YuxK
MRMQSQPVILFDGVCNLCNGVVRLVIRQDKKAHFKFASLQSEAAVQLLQPYGVLKKFDSFILLEDGTLFQKSTAALKVFRRMPWYWQWTQLFWIVPTPVRDAVYDFIAKNRYNWFGKKEACMLPTPAIRNRFLS